MFANSLKIAFRSLWKNKGYTFLNTAGLALGMACSILAALWTYDELTYDQFHENYKTIYQVGRNSERDGTIVTNKNTPYPLAEGLKQTYPDIARASRVTHPAERLLAAADKKIYQDVLLVDPDFLKMFTFSLSQGTPATALSDPRSIVLSQKTATSLFGEENPLGKIVSFNNLIDVKVTGVLADMPANSTLKFDCVLPYSLYPIMDDFYKTLDDNWGNNVVRTFIELKPKVTAERVVAKIAPFLTANDETVKQTLMLHAMPDWRLRDKFENGKITGGMIDYVRIFLWVAGFVLLIACINFMNLSTARSEKRAREVGVRKAVGSSRGRLVARFLGESNLLAFLGFALAVLLVVLLLPWFNQLTDKEISLPYTQPVAWLIGLGITLLTGMAAGLYPALYLSSFQPVRALKNVIQIGKSAGVPRKVMVGLQFTISILLIISVLVIGRQLRYTKDRTVGYDRSNLIMAEFPDQLRQKEEVLRNELLNSGFVSSVTGTLAPMTEIWNTNGVRYDGDKNTTLVTVSSDYDYVETFGIKLKSGRSFSRDFATDSSAVLLNESAVKAMNLSEPLGVNIEHWGKTYHVIGVIDDVLMDSPYENVRPTGVFFDQKHLYTLNIRFREGVNTREALAGTKAIYEKLAPAYPFAHKFVDEEYDRKFASEERIGNLINAFALLTIFISCLGLFGLAAYTAERRTKEIGVRKVLGADVSSIVLMLSKEYVYLIGIASLLAAPVAWYFLHDWLQNYAYRIEIPWWIFILSGVLALAVALLTVSFQSVRAALMNPVKSLRSE
ncbi:ABC transporter permease [Salmonirosea aquatica]|uniref:FtsX-like permease family protein n=1 Tax=Salmonirosea aquatica TaxID=2654236 RepID=A0A7C9F6Z3_9BACT|nr:FtsX-like permease family protein [Cytophagaceae bacterium SJW1-29]